ncbi:phospholipase D family protein [Rugosimonospora africana]|uniref:Phospholipase D n=1 Tax=Rugosimonospora africana TaxID=556532 RepID=A0A8J3QNY5_9ACTN|nr:phospholipase D-like domain-containing protein [Rugosimonospora africana]GIH13042.1 phospholipase D [Rugosimonospora africana]
MPTRSRPQDERGESGTRPGPVLPAPRLPYPDDQLSRIPATGSRAVSQPPPCPADWFLSAEERGNPDTGIDRRHAGGEAWTVGNEVVPLVHGREYFAALREAVSATRAGDLVLFTDWRGDPDEPVDDEGTSISSLLCHAAARGVTVKGLIWRSHLDLLRFSSAENRRLGAEIEAAGGECLLDMRIRWGGSHHQKMVVVRYRDRSSRDVAFVGGIDLCHSRRDDERHHGDPRKQEMPSVYGDPPPWHDIQLAVRGPAVGDVEATFRERWTDPAALSHNPIRLLGSIVDHDDLSADRLPEQSADPGACGSQAVQVLRTYPRRYPGYPFARAGERSIARAYLKAVGRARSLIYLEDQYLWSTEVTEVFAAALRREPQLLMVAVIPLHPDTDGSTARAECVGRARALRMLHDAGRDRVAVYGIENHESRPIYVHAKVCVIDDVWTCVGSDNLNLRSWTHDSELSCAVMDTDAGTGFGRALRLRLAHEHLDRAAGDDADLRDPRGLFDAYRHAAGALDDWHRLPDGTPRPRGRLRAYHPPHLGRLGRLLAVPMYRYLCDPDGRPRVMRRARSF